MKKKSKLRIAVVSWSEQSAKTEAKRIEQALAKPVDTVVKRRARPVGKLAKPIVPDEPEGIVKLRERIGTWVDVITKDAPSESVKLLMVLVAEKLGENEAARIIIDTHGLDKFGLKREENPK